jgi:hypothetical protein
MNKSLIWAWAIKNSIAIIAWTALAIIFHKWWIARFAALFISGLETKYKNYRICDKCGKHIPYSDSYNDALEAAKRDGWMHVADGNLDYCPECRKEYNK